MALQTVAIGQGMTAAVAGSLQGREMAGAGYKPSVREVQLVRVVETKNGRWCLEVDGGLDGWLPQFVYDTRRHAYLNARFRRDTYGAHILCPNCVSGEIGYDEHLSCNSCSYTGHLKPEPEPTGIFLPWYGWYLIVCAAIFGAMAYILFAGGR